jgi:GNAT superfamily N-acetyltransferase
MPMITLSPAGLSDIPLMWDLRTRALTAHCAGHYAPDTLRRWADAAVPANYPTLLAQGRAVKAAIGGELAGYAILDLARCEVEAVFVAPRFGGKGVGKALLNALDGMAQEPARLYLYASLNAVPFYESAGYRAVKKTQYQHPCGILLDCVYMTRTAGEPPGAACQQAT